MGPRYSNIGAAQALVASWREVARRRVARHDLGVRRRRRRSRSPRPRASRATIFPIKLPITDANSTILQLVQAAGDGGGVILDFTPDTAPALHEGGHRAGPRRQGAVGLVDADRQRRSWRSSSRSSTARCTSTRSSATSTTARRTRRCTCRSRRSTRRSIAPQAFGQMGFMDAKFATQALLNVKGAVTAKSYNAAVRRPQERQDEHALQAVVRRQQPRVPHPEQRGHHRHVQGRQGRAENEQAASRSRRSTRSSRRRARGRRSSSLNTGGTSSRGVTIRAPVSADG